MDPIIELFSFQGRVNRGWYFLHIVLDDLAIIGLLILLVTLSAALSTPLLFLPILGVIAGGLWSAIAVTVKRLHDLDRPGSHWWLLMVPIYNIYLGFVLLLGKGTHGRNRFGPDPLMGPEPGGYLQG